jgi:hypothetical protein
MPEAGSAALNIFSRRNAIILHPTWLTYNDEGFGIARSARA